MLASWWQEHTSRANASRSSGVELKSPRTAPFGQQALAKIHLLSTSQIQAGTYPKAVCTILEPLASASDHCSCDTASSMSSPQTLKAEDVQRMERPQWAKQLWP